MLRDQHGVQTNGLIVIVILNGHLGLAVRRRCGTSPNLRTSVIQTEGEANVQVDRSSISVEGLSHLAANIALIAGTCSFVTLFAAGVPDRQSDGQRPG